MQCGKQVLREIKRYRPSIQVVFWIQSLPNAIQRSESTHDKGNFPLGMWKVKKLDRSSPAFHTAVNASYQAAMARAGKGNPTKSACKSMGKSVEKSKLLYYMGQAIDKYLNVVSPGRHDEAVNLCGNAKKFEKAKKQLLMKSNSLLKKKFDNAYQNSLVNREDTGIGRNVGPTLMWLWVCWRRERRLGPRLGRAAKEILSSVALDKHVILPVSNY